MSMLEAVVDKALRLAISLVLARLVLLGLRRS